METNDRATEAKPAWRGRAALIQGSFTIFD
jgi:hypothetical protein